jgi:hypothetical protein
MTENVFTAGQGVPARLVAENFWTWRADGLAAAYPSDAYSLAYTFAPRIGGTATVVSATGDADGWLVEVPGATTAPLVPGTYAWSLVATRISDGASASIVCGVLEVTPNPAGGTDTRTTARRHLDAINAVLDGRITKDVESYSIEGRALTRVPLEVLHKLRARYMAEAQAEDRLAAGKAPGPRVRKLRF